MGVKITEENTFVRPHKYLGFEIVWQPVAGDVNTKPKSTWRRTEEEAEEFRQELIKTQGKIPKKGDNGDGVQSKPEPDTTG